MKAKTCSTCGETQPIDAYSRNARADGTGDGYTARCKTCRSAAARAIRRRGPIERAPGPDELRVEPFLRWLDDVRARTGESWQCLCWRLGLNERSVRDMRAGQRAFVGLGVADEAIMRDGYVTLHDVYA